jgi:hypothetical protein
MVKEWDSQLILLFVSPRFGEREHHVCARYQTRCVAGFQAGPLNCRRQVWNLRDGRLGILRYAKQIRHGSVATGLLRSKMGFMAKRNAAYFFIVVFLLFLYEDCFTLSLQGVF